MSMAYCYYCLESFGDDEDYPDCQNHCDKVVYGELRVAYLRGYRDAKDGKEENI